ncbi:MAG: cupin-like domain-containing protein [Bacteroidia bacterium]
MRQDPRLPECPFSWRQRAVYNFFQFLDHFISRPVTVWLFGKWRMREFKKVRKTLEARGTSTIVPVERRKDITVEELKNDYIKKGIPVIIEGGAKGWECCQKWDFNYLHENYGEDEIPILDVVYLEDGLRYIKLKEAIKEMQLGKGTYFRFYNLLNRHKETRRDFDFEYLKSIKHKSNYGEFTQAFIGPKDSVTALHNSHAQNLFVQVYGEKEWYLYPNYFSPLIDPPSTTGGTYRVSPRRGAEAKPFNPFNPDFKTYPLYKYIDGYHVKLKPGDIFYNPPYMWHTVRNLTDNIGVGYRWLNAFSAFSTAPTYYSLDLMAYRPSYFKAYKWHLEDGNKEFIYAQKLVQKRIEKMRVKA